MESPNCTFCQEAAESVEHLLFSCGISSEFWKHVLSWLRDNDVHVETINESDMIFGKFDIVEDYILINHILLLGKYYIYCRKCHNSVPSTRGFIAGARRVFNIELHIARARNKLLFHFQKWEKQTNTLNNCRCTGVRKNATLFLSRDLYCCRRYCNLYLLHTYWEILTKKLCRKFSYAN